MFGYVTANYKELTPEQRTRYGAVYCGICRGMLERSGGLSRLGLRYDMAFLSLLLMSLYEPEEQSGCDNCTLHPIKRRDWTDNTYVRYSADMNILLAYYKCLDDWEDDRRVSAKLLAGTYKKGLDAVAERYPRQSAAVRDCLQRLSETEKAGCTNPDEPAGAFGELMGQLLIYEEDIWAPTLRAMGDALGRFIYLVDALIDRESDLRHGRYNPFASTEETPEQLEDALVHIMGRCTAEYEKLPLVQDKELLDNILYSGVWVRYREHLGRKKGKEERHG